MNNNPKSVDWDNLCGKRQVLGVVGVDSASVRFSDSVDRDQGEIYTPEGDGSFPIYAQLIDGRRCLVVDFDANLNIDQGILERVPANWKCLDCGEDELSGWKAAGSSGFTCANNHTHEVEHVPITDLQAIFSF